MPAFQIHTLDLNFLDTPEAIAAFLVIGPAGPVLVECGPGSTLPALLSELKRFGIAPADVRDVLLTHIHLDHAGTAGWWARQGARIHVHHIGAPHLIDPSKLLASAQRIYGDQMDYLWGEFLPVPAEQLQVLHDGAVINAGGLHFTAHDTPGHAKHHFVYQLDDVAFTGDLVGARLAGRSYLRMPTPPPDFDLAAWEASVARMRALKFERLYLTHFGAVIDIDTHWENVTGLLQVMTTQIGEALAQGADRSTLIDQLTAWENVRAQALGLDAATQIRYNKAGPLEMSVDGLIRYWNKRVKP